MSRQKLDATPKNLHGPRHFLLETFPGPTDVSKNLRTNFDGIHKVGYIAGSIYRCLVVRIIRMINVILLVDLLTFTFNTSTTLILLLLLLLLANRPENIFHVLHVACRCIVEFALLTVAVVALLVVVSRVYDWFLVLVSGTCERKTTNTMV